MKRGFHRGAAARLWRCLWHTQSGLHDDMRAGCSDYAQQCVEQCGANCCGVSLDCVPPGASATITEVLGGREVFSRLATLGFTPGAALTMIQNVGRGPLIVAIRSARIALGRGEARHVHVQLDGSQAAGSR